jgi:enoyl-[acyl-carrier protein] reductase III
MTDARDFFQNKKAFITGSGRGIGRAIALELAKSGTDILLHYRKDKAAVLEVQNEIQKLGRTAWVYQGDLCDLNQTTKLLDHITAEHKTLDFYIANAASTSFKSLTDLTTSNIEKTLTLVVTSFLLSVQKLKPLLANRDAKILTISGIDTRRFCPGHGLLAAAKSALETLTKYLAVELSADGIRTRCLNPGLVASDSTKFYLGSAFDEICQKANDTAPVKGFASPDDIAKLARLFLSPETDFIACHTLSADGGLGFMLPSF